MKTPEQLTERLKEALGPNLKNVVLYGSAASDERVALSDYNVLVIVNDLNLKTLDAMAPLARAWAKGGNPPPLLFTEERIRQAEDVFPIEFLDIQSSHRVLFGNDPFASLAVNTRHLRHQLEYELRGKLLQLQQRYMEARGPRDVQALAQKSLSTFIALFKGVLRMLGETPPAQRHQVFAHIKKYVEIDEPVLLDIFYEREGKKSARKPEELFEGLLVSIQRVVDLVNHHKNQEEK